MLDFPGGAADTNPAANAGDTGSVPAPGGFHKPQGNEARASQLLNPCPRASAPHPEKPPQGEARAPSKDPGQPINKQIKTSELRLSLACHLPS